MSEGKLNEPIFPVDRSQNEVSRSPVPQASAQVSKEPVQFSFPDAMREVMTKKRITRLSWESNNDYCYLDENHGFLMIFTKGALHTWTVSVGDMEGIDWVVLPEQHE